MTDVLLKDIYDEVVRSNKYSGLYNLLVMRICAEEYKKHNKKTECVKAVKKKLHMVYGAFLNNSLQKKREMLLDELNFEKILKLHASTAERLPVITEFYKHIFNYAPCCKILDIGCGYNPFSMPYMPKKPKEYHAIDIDYKAASFINRYFENEGLPPYGICMDVINETPVSFADTAFIFKLMPVLESQKSGRGFELLNELNVKFIVVTYPTKSLGGKEKGMDKHYPAVFYKSVGNTFKIINNMVIGNELIYIIKKHFTSPKII